MLNAHVATDGVIRSKRTMLFHLHQPGRRAAA